MTGGGIDRREFLKGAAAAAFVFAADELFAAEAIEQTIKGPAVKFGVVGLGQWGSQIVSTLAKLPSAKVTALCDTYEPYVKRATKSAPGAAEFSDYRKLIESKDVEAVVVATPTHLHKDIVLAALQAGKHVYCEAPLAASIEEAGTIARAGLNAKQIFQAGLQGRSNLLYKHVETFVRTACLGSIAQVYAQCNKKQSWQRVAPTPEREKELNWRLEKSISTGLVGELGIHPIDLANRYLDAKPLSIIGFGTVAAWKDGREVPDTVQCVIEYPKGVRMIFASTIASSFSGDYSLFQGSDSSLLLREDRGWMVKEADAPMLGWEVYARREQCFEETGICMVADATKIIQAGKEPAQEKSIAPTKQPLQCALEDFTRSIREGAKVACGPAEGYAATVTVLKANEAIVTGSQVRCEPVIFELN